jgi:hypothetical protein
MSSPSRDSRQRPLFSLEYRAISGLGCAILRVAPQCLDPVEDIAHLRLAGTQRSQAFMIQIPGSPTSFWLFSSVSRARSVHVGLSIGFVRKYRDRQVLTASSVAPSTISASRNPSPPPPIASLLPGSSISRPRREKASALPERRENNVRVTRSIRQAESAS